REKMRMGKSENGPRNLWCCTCPKCAFVFALYAAFISREKLEAVFGRNLYDDQSLLPLYRELLGLERIKPFECVGTPEETAAAFLLARERGQYLSSPAMIMFEKEKLPSIKNPELLIREALEASKEHAIPMEYLQNFPEVLSPKS
ncbi:MAG TPA: hypothetical protein VI873_03725, partial [Candidatus Peribacteraceae bacterium]|nr:hypothetical protein [Candidatus Peribacteraceae bacterium]